MGQPSKLPSPGSNKQRILGVEDEPIVGLSLKCHLQSLGFSVTVVSSGSDALAEVAKELPHFMLMDIRIKGEIDGVETAKLIRMRHEIPFAFVTAYSDEAYREKIATSGACAVLEKPYTQTQLEAVVFRACGGGGQ